MDMLINLKNVFGSLQKSGLLDSALLSISTGDFGSSRSGTSLDSNLTGKVGTALYVSPEMMKGGNKASYNQVNMDDIREILGDYLMNDSCFQVYSSASSYYYFLKLLLL